MDNIILFAIIAVVALVLLIKGVVRTFQRNWIAALIVLIFLFPLYCIWAFVELFLSPPKPKVHYVQIQKDD